MEQVRAAVLYAFGGKEHVTAENLPMAVYRFQLFRTRRVLQTSCSGLRTPANTKVFSRNHFISVCNGKPALSIWANPVPSL